MARAPEQDVSKVFNEENTFKKVIKKMWKTVFTNIWKNFKAFPCFRQKVQKIKEILNMLANFKKPRTNFMGFEKFLAKIEKLAQTIFSRGFVGGRPWRWRIFDFYLLFRLALMGRWEVGRGRGFLTRQKACKGVASAVWGSAGAVPRTLVVSKIVVEKSLKNAIFQ